MREHDRVVRDNVHRDIVLTDDMSRLVDTRTFQRLRDIKQLATCHYVFPTATHTRFVHSLGAQHLAGILLKHLETVNPGRISPEDARLVRFAALLHDIGHPPFSHALESDKVVQSALGQSLYEEFMAVKRGEWVQYNRCVTQWEVDRFLTAI